MSRRKSLGVRVCCIVLCIFGTLTNSSIQSAQAQLTHTPEQLPGWPIKLAGALKRSNIIITDIDNNGKDEIIMGVDNEVYIIDETGKNLPGWPQQAGNSRVHEITAVAAGDIDGDGDKDIVGAGEGGVYAWHFNTGTLFAGWPLNIEGDMVLGNFDDNPLDLEIAVAFAGRYNTIELAIFILNSDGTNVDGWPQYFDIDQLSQVYLSAGNIDNTDSDEIVVACHKIGYYASSIYVFHGDGQLASGWPIEGNGPFVSPAILCNLDGDDNYEVVAATVNESHTGKIYAWKANGVGVSGWPRSCNAFHLAVGDLNSDDQPEIIASYSNTSYWADHLAVIDANGIQLLSKTLELRDAATLGNSDNDTDSEIIIPSWNGNLHVMDIDGQDLPGFPIYISRDIYGRQSALGDLDGDGDIEIVQPEGARIHAFDLKVPKSERPDWPMIRHDERRSSLWTPPRTEGFDILEITGPLEVMENSSTRYTACAYFEDGSNKDVTLEADWWVDPCSVDYAHFEPEGVLVAHGVPIFKDIIIHAEYLEGDFAQSASYEVRIRPTVQVLYVDDNSANDPGPNNPSISDPDEHGTEQHPFDTIQEAIDVVGNGHGDTVIVLPGYYLENVDCMKKDFTLTSTNPDDPEIVASTIISNEGLGGVAIRASDGSILGFKISGGINIGNLDPPTACSPTISHCNITSTGSSIQIRVPADQGPVAPIIENNIISVDSGSCIYMSSVANANGGVEGIIRNNVLTGNGSNGSGISYRAHKSMPIIANNIIYNLKYGIYLTYTSRLEERIALIRHNNLYNNQENYHIDSPPTPLDLTGLNGNISIDPLFVDPNDGNYHLLPNSPCIDAGDNSVVEPNSTDLDGNERIINGIVDMGAYEALLPIEADVHIVPRVLNRRSHMKRVIAIVRLPEGVSKHDVADEPFVLYAGDSEGIEAIWQRVIGWGRRASVFVLFDKAELMDAAPNNGRVELTVVGKLKSGQCIYGSDTIRIIQPRRRSRRWWRRW